MSDETIETMGEALQEFFKDRSVTYDRQLGWLWVPVSEDDFSVPMEEDEVGTLLYLMDHYVNDDWPGGDE